MRKIGLLINPHAKKARRQPRLIQSMIEAFPDQESVWMPKNLEDLSRITKHILDENYEILFLSGGDGTFRATVEEFIKHGSGKMPHFVLLQGGTGCLYSKHYYGAQNPLTQLQSTLEKLKEAKELITTPINILNVNGHYGFIFAVGGFSNVLSYYMGHKERSIALANWILFKIALSFIFGTSMYKRFFPTFSVEMKNQNQIRTFETNTIACSSLPVGYILSPFYGVEVNQHFTGIVFYKSPFGLFKHLPSLLRQQHIETEDAERFKSDGIDLFLKQPLQPMVDGDMLEPTQKIEVKLGPQINLLTL